MRNIAAAVAAFCVLAVTSTQSLAADSSSSSPPPIAAVPGKMGVSATGAFTYTIPIMVPPGTNNLVPALSLDYSSQYGDGTVGMGWTLAGLPTITRCPQTLAQDGVHGSVNYALSDRLCMNGQRLILIAGTGKYWDDGSQYRTEVETFSEIILHIHTAGANYRWFEVHSKNGQVLQFGNSPDSRLLAVGTDAPRTWAVNQIADTKGNYLAVTYENDTTNGEAYPVEIDYTGNEAAGLVPYNSVKFVYEDRAATDIVPTYQAGSLMQTTVLLQEIDTYINANSSSPTPVLKYKLAYQNAGTTVGAHSASHDELTSVQQCPGVGSCPTQFKTTFTWQGSGLAPAVDATNIMPFGQWYPTSMPNILPGDYTGDGLTDFAVMTPFQPSSPYPCPAGPGEYSFYFGTGSGTPSSFIGQTSLADYCPIKGQSYTYPYYSSGESTGDFNGDGLTDLVSEFATGAAHWAVALSTGTSFTNGPIVTMPVNFGFPLAYADFNGDGLTDAMAEMNSGTTAPPYGPPIFYYSKGDGSFNQVNATIGAGTYVTTADFDGDGCADIMGTGAGLNSVLITYSCNPAVANSTTAVSSLNVGPPAVEITGDFNGDGKADFIDSSGQLFLSTGTGLAPTSFVAPSTWGIDGAQVGDFNGDGKQDIVLTSSDLKYIEIWVSTGLKGAYGSSTSAFTELYSLTLPAQPPYIGPSFIVADLNNDGAQDVWIQSNVASQPELLFDYVPELMTTITDGLDAKVTAQYKPLSTNGSFYTKGTSAAYPTQDMDGPQYFVSETQTSNGITAGTYNTTYSYAGAQTDLHGRGFLGFATVTATDVQTHLFTTTTYSTTFPTVGMIEAQTKTCPASVCAGGPLTLQNTNNCYSVPVCFDVVNLGGTPGTGAAYYFVGIKQSVTTSNDLNNAPFPTVTTANTYDCDGPLPCYGNTTQVVVSIPDGSHTDTKATTNAYYNYVATVSGQYYWLIGRLTKSTVESTLGDGSSEIKRVTSFCYDLTIAPPGTSCPTTSGTPSGLLTQQIVEPGASHTQLTLETDYAFDNFGNHTITTQKGCVWIPSTSCAYTDPTASRQIMATYSTTTPYNGQFATTVTDANGFSEHRDFNVNFGTMSDSTDVNGLETFWSYDRYGRETLEQQPDHNQTATSYTYCTGLPAGESCPTQGAFDVIATPENSSGAQNGPVAVVYYDHLARVIDKDVEGFDVPGGSCVATAPCWIRVETDYDALGHVAQTSRPYFLSGGTAEFTGYKYDALGRVIEADFPNSSRALYGFSGLTTTVENGLNQTTTTIKNAQGTIASVQDANLKTTNYTYDAFGDLLTVTDPESNQTINTYDVRGRKLTSTNGDMGLWSYVYDGFGELASQTDSASKTINLQYDSIGHLVLRAEDGPNTNWTYGTSVANCNVEQLTEAKINSSTYDRTIAYDGYCRPHIVTLALGSAAPVNYTITYNSDGRMDTVTYPSGLEVQYLYTANGYLYQIQNASSGAAYITLNSRDAEMHWTGLTDQSTMANGRSYDPVTGLISHVGANPSGSSNVSFDYSFDAIGNLVKRVDNVENYTEHFCYDNLNRLTSYQLTTSTSCPLSGSGATTVGYDDLGNITSKSDVASGGTYSYGGTGPHQVTSIAGTVWPGVSNPSFSYTLRGGMYCVYTGASCGSTPFRQFSYTSFNMVASIVQNSAALGNASLTYAYDDARARFQQVQTTASDTQTTLYFNFGGLMSEQVTDSATSTVTTNDYLMVDGEIVGEHTLVNGSANNYYFVNDSLGSVSLVAKGTGAIQERDSYDAWGLRRNLDGSPATTQCLPPSPPSKTTRGYTNQEMVDSACLINLNARFYDPLIARMPQADSVVGDAYNLQSLNRYSYVNNGPLSATDPTGNETFIDNWVSNHATAGDNLECFGNCGAGNFDAQMLGDLLVQGQIAQGTLAASSTASGVTTNFSGNQITGITVTTPFTNPTTGQQGTAQITSENGRLTGFTEKMQTANGDNYTSVNQITSAQANVLAGNTQRAGVNFGFAGGSADMNGDILIAAAWPSNGPPEEEEVVKAVEEGCAKQPELCVAIVAGAFLLTATGDSPQSGSYTNTHASGKSYSGKGDRARSQASGRRIERETGDPHTATDWTPAQNSREGFKQESTRIDQTGGKNSPSNYNKIESPGKKMLQEDQLQDH